MSIYDGKIEPLPTQKKTLIEQLRERTLEDGFYYMLIDCGAGEFTYINEVYDKCPQDYNDEYIKEVLAPVPSYDEYCNLVFQANKPKNPLSDVMMCYDTEREKKVVEHLQEQLADANKTIDYYDKKDFHYTLDDGTVMGAEPAHKYKTKWGAK